MAQLGERRVRNAEVEGSNPFGSIYSSGFNIFSLFIDDSFPVFGRLFYLYLCNILTMMSIFTLFCLAPILSAYPDAITFSPIFKILLNLLRLSRGILYKSSNYADIGPLPQFTERGRFIVEDYITKALAGDHQAFCLLYDHFSADALRLAAAITRSNDMAADAVQESFLRVYKKGYQCKSPDSFRPWFFKIVVNESKRLLKKHPLETELNEDYQSPGNSITPEFHLILSDALSKLSWEHRSALVLKF